MTSLSLHVTRVVRLLLSYAPMQENTWPGWTRLWAQPVWASCSSTVQGWGHSGDRWCLAGVTGTSGCWWGLPLDFRAAFVGLATLKGPLAVHYCAYINRKSPSAISEWPQVILDRPPKLPGLWLASL